MDKKLCRAALKLPQNVRLVGTAGALHKNRSIHFLFEAFDRLKPKYPDLHLVLAGPRNVPIPVHHSVYDLGIMPLKKVPLLLNALDVAMVSNRENDFGKYCFPQKIREIVACDVPVVAARVRSMAELFVDEPQWLYTSDDAVDLAQVLEHRLNNPITDYQGVFSWSEIAEDLKDIFLEICRDSQQIATRA